MKYKLTLALVCLLISCNKDSNNEKLEKDSLTVDSILTKPVDDTIITIEDKMIGNLTDTLELPEYVINTLNKIPDSLQIKYTQTILGDFNADNKQDFASLVVNTKNKKVGVIIIHNDDKNSFVVFGAGKEVYEMTDLSWIEVFEPLPKGQIIAETKVDPTTGDILGLDPATEFELLGTGIIMTLEESCGGGIIYWTGEEYNWYHVE